MASRRADRISDEFIVSRMPSSRARQDRVKGSNTIAGSSPSFSSGGLRTGSAIRGPRRKGAHKHDERVLVQRRAVLKGHAARGVQMRQQMQNKLVFASSYPCRLVARVVPVAEGEYLSEPKVEEIVDFSRPMPEGLLQQDLGKDGARRRRPRSRTAPGALRT